MCTKARRQTRGADFLHDNFHDGMDAMEIPRLPERWVVSHLPTSQTTPLERMRGRSYSGHTLRNREQGPHARWLGETGTLSEGM